MSKAGAINGCVKEKVPGMWLWLNRRNRGGRKDGSSSDWHQVSAGTAIFADPL